MPIEDPAQRIAYLKRFRSTMNHARDSRAFGPWYENIRSDLATILDPQVKTEAHRLFSQIQSCTYFLERDPEHFSVYFCQAVDALIAYLEANDH